MALIFDPTMQQCIIHMYTKFHDFSFNSSWENRDTKKSDGVMELRIYRQTKPSIAILFQKIKTL